MKKLLLLLLATNVVACSAVGYSSDADSSATKNDKSYKKALVTVFKDAQKKQCFSEGIPLETMKSELDAAGIPVMCAQKANDGMMYTAACGQDEGTVNAYQISFDDLEKAQVLGFSNVNTLKSAEIKLNCK